MTAQPWMSARLVVVDVEGHGGRPPRLVELAVVPIVGGIIGEPATWLVRPPESISWQATRVHGITNRDVAHLRPVEAVADDIRAYLDGAVVVAHAAHVDVGVLSHELPDWRPAAVVDTLKLARRVYPHLRSHRLGALVDELDLARGLAEGMRPHRADYDAAVTARLLLRLIHDGGMTQLDEITCEGSGPIAHEQPRTEALF